MFLIEIDSLSKITGESAKVNHALRGRLKFLNFFLLKKIFTVSRLLTKNKWPKSDEKTGFGGTLGLAP